MKPPEQPNAFEARDVLQRVLVATIRKQFEDVALLQRIDGLVARVKFQRLLSRDKSDRLKCERVRQASKKPGRAWEVYIELSAANDRTVDRAAFASILTIRRTRQRWAALTMKPGHGFVPHRHGCSRHSL